MRTICLWSFVIVLLAISTEVMKADGAANIICKIKQLPDSAKVVAELDRVGRLMLDSDSISAVVVDYGEGNMECGRIPDTLESIVKLQMCRPSMYRTDKKVYTKFEPYAILTFYGQDEPVSLLLDYSSRKWELRTGDDSLISRHDIPDFDLLDVLCVLFPDSDLFSSTFFDYICRE